MLTKPSAPSASSFEMPATGYAQQICSASGGAPGQPTGSGARGEHVPRVALPFTFEGRMSSNDLIAVLIMYVPDPPLRSSSRVQSTCAGSSPKGPMLAGKVGGGKRAACAWPCGSRRLTLVNLTPAVAARSMTSLGSVVNPVPCCPMPWMWTARDASGMRNTSVKPAARAFMHVSTTQKSVTSPHTNSRFPRRASCIGLQPRSRPSSAMAQMSGGASMSTQISPLGSTSSMPEHLRMTAPLQGALAQPQKSPKWGFFARLVFEMRPSPPS
mmetsp:Transcript_26300/g.69778  ORF Transcript_26300/g.69778 Transcript_26300/m.69778 type:complete len:270 (-) Transcript_26300:34-843(-)